MPGGLLFQAGKAGVGYLIDEATMHSGAGAVYSGQVCGGAASFGGDAYANHTIYLACTNGVQALAYNETARTFTPLWQGPADAFGPPIVSAGLVWVLATGGFSGGGQTLYGLDPSTGKARYTEQLPSPIADHFGSPSAAGGRLFAASGSTVTAYQVARVPGVGCTLAGGGGREASEADCPPGASAGGPPGPVGVVGSHHSPPPTPRVSLVHRRLHATTAGRVRVALQCTPAGSACRGIVRLHAEIPVGGDTSNTGRRRVVTVPLAHARFGPARGTIELTLRLDRAARTLLAHHRRVMLSVVIASPGGLVWSVRAVLT